jgi:Ca2+-dependent lipid-binding protein
MIIWTNSSESIKAGQRTKTHFDGGKIAEWNESFVLNVKDQESELFFVEVMDHNDYATDRLIGKAKFLCADIGLEAVEAWVRIFRLDGADAGEVLIQMQIK